MLSGAEILEICRRYAWDNFYVGEAVPAEKAQNAFKAFAVPEGETMYALADFTFVGNAKQGVALCDSGIYWRNMWSRADFLSWSDLAALPLKQSKLGAVHMGADDLLNTGAKTQLLPLLQEVQMLLRSRMEMPEAAPVADSAEQWLVFANGKQFGPYDQQTIIDMAGGGMIDPAQAHAWREGMPEWKPLLKIPEFEIAGVLHTRKQEAGPPAEAGVLKKTRETLKPLDLATATVDDLVILPGMTRAAAASLIDENKRCGGFTSTEDVAAFLNLPPHELEALRPHITFSERRSAPLPPHAPLHHKRVVDF